MGGSYRAPRQEDDPMLAVTAASEKATLAQKKAVAKAEAAAQGLSDDQSDASSSGDEGVVIKKNK